MTSEQIAYKERKVGQKHELAIKRAEINNASSLDEKNSLKSDYKLLKKKHKEALKDIKYHDPVVTAVRMQLKEQSSSSGFFSSRPTFFRYIFEALKFIILTVLLFAIIYFLLFFRIISNTDRFGIRFVTVVFTLISIVLVLTSSTSFAKLLYERNDNRLLFTFPLTHFQVFLSKVLVFAIEDIKRSAFVYFPLFLAIGISAKMGISYYLWILFMFPFIALIFLSLGMVFAILVFVILRGFSRFKYSGFLIIIVAVIAIAGLFIFAVYNLPSNFNLIGRFGEYYQLIQNFMKSVDTTAVPFNYIVRMLIGTEFNNSLDFKVTLQMWMTLFILIVSLVGIFTGGFFLHKALFYKIATAEGERQRANKKEMKNLSNRPFTSALRNEWKGYGRSPLQFISKYLLIVFVPFVVMLLVLLVHGMSARARGYEITVAFSILMLLLSFLASNVFASHLLSSDGKASYHLKTSPVKPQTMINAKLLTHVLIHVGLLIGTISAVAVVSRERIDPAIWVFALIIILFFDFAHLLYSVSLDISNPQFARYVNGQPISLNPNKTHSAAMAVIISVLVSGLILFCIFAVNFGAFDPYGIFWRLSVAACLVFTGSVVYYYYQYKVYIRDFC